MTANALQDDRKHHSNGMAGIIEGSMGYPSGNGIIPVENGFLSEMLPPHGWDAYREKVHRRQLDLSTRN